MIVKCHLNQKSGFWVAPLMVSALSGLHNLTNKVQLNVTLIFPLGSEFLNLGYARFTILLSARHCGVSAR